MLQSQAQLGQLEREIGRLVSPWLGSGPRVPGFETMTPDHAAFIMIMANIRMCRGESACPEQAQLAGVGIGRCQEQAHRAVAAQAVVLATASPAPLAPKLAPHVHPMMMHHVVTPALPAALRKASELPKSPMVLGWLGLALAQGGNVTEARGLLQNLYARAERTYVPPSNFAWIHFGLGEIDDAFVWMDRAVEARDNMMTPIKSYPFLDPIRNDPRFTALLRKMNLASAPNEPCRAGSGSRPEPKPTVVA